MAEGTIHHKFYDSVILDKIRNLLGGRVRVVSTGAAPITKEVLFFLKVALSAAIHEGYG